MSKKNKRRSSNAKVTVIGGLMSYIIFGAFIIGGAAMIYYLGLPFVTIKNYYMILSGTMLSLIFLTAGKIPATATTILAALLLITMGILHPLTLFLAACGVYIIVNKILILTGHRILAEKIDEKFGQFMYKLVEHELRPNPEYMNQSSRNKYMGIKKVKDLSNQKETTKKEQTAPVTTAQAHTVTCATDTLPQSDTAFPFVEEPDRTASEEMARPDPGQFITNFVAGFIFTMGGLMSTLPTLIFFTYSGILGQLPFLLFGGIMLAIGIWQLVKGFKTYKQYSRK